MLEALASASQEQVAIVPEAVTKDLVSAFDEIAQVAGLDKQAKDVVRTRLRSVGTPSLKQRIESLLEPVIPSLAGLMSGPHRFARKIADVRNALAHGGGLRVDAEEAFWLTRAGHFVVVALLINKLGFGPDRVAEALSRVPAYSRTCEACQAYGWGISDEG